MISFNAEQRFVVTGASSGIGEGVALLLNELGATIVAITRREDRLKELKLRAKHPDNMLIEVKDLTEDIEGLPAFVKYLKEKYGKFQGMAYCAGLGGIHPLRMIDMETMQKIFAINYFVPVFLVKGFADKRNNNGKGTSIVCIASAGGVHCDPGMTCYAGSKGALIATMQSIARELAPAGLRVNCVSPTLIATNMAGEIERQFAEGKYPFGLGEVSDVANMIVYLLSEQAKWITAQNYIIDCGAI